ncbi:MAG TPA: hypothetical protein VLA00_13730 [Xanthobacteraceae bacterium]|nr:hypothetical protein [Xanthobacteraceae bacterium]
MPIRPLLEIAVAHPFFASGLFAGARLVPDAATEARLRGLRLIAKRQGAALTLYAEFDAAGGLTIPLPPATRLRFDLLALPPDLAAATDLTAFAPGATFTDEGADTQETLRLTVPEARGQETLEKPEGAATLVLAGRPRLGAAGADFAILPPGGVRVTAYDPAANRVTMEGPAARFVLDYPVAAPARPGVLAAIDIAIGPQTAVLAAAGTPRRCRVALAPVSARWCYHLVTDLPQPLADWRIAAGTGGGPKVSFGAGGRAEIAAVDPEDSFGTHLWRQAAPLRVLRFVSDAPAACSETVARRVSLFAGDMQLFAALPNPSPGQRRRIAGQEAFGEVLRIITN